MQINLGSVVRLDFHACLWIWVNTSFNKINYHQICVCFFLMLLAFVLSIKHSVFWLCKTEHTHTHDAMKQMNFHHTQIITWKVSLTFSALLLLFAFLGAALWIYVRPLPQITFDVLINFWLFFGWWFQLWMRSMRSKTENNNETSCEPKTVEWKQ